MKKVHSAVNIRVEDKFTNDFEINNCFYRPTSAIHQNNLFKNKLNKTKRLSTLIYASKSKSTMNSTSSSFLLRMSSSSKLLLYDESLQLKQQRNSLINKITLLKSNIRKKENQIRHKEKQIENNYKVQALNHTDYHNYEKIVDDCSLSKIKTTFNNLKSAYNTLIDSNKRYKSIIRQSKQSEAFIQAHMLNNIKDLVSKYFLLQQENKALSEEYDEYIEMTKSHLKQHYIINIMQKDFEASTNRVKQYQDHIQLMNKKSRHVNNQIKTLKLENENKGKQLSKLYQEKQCEEEYLKNKSIYEAKIIKYGLKIKEYKDLLDNKEKVIKEIQNVNERLSKRVITHTNIKKRINYEVFEPNPHLNNDSKLLLTQSFINESKQKQCKYKSQLQTIIKELTECGIQVQSIDEINKELSNISMKYSTITFNSHHNTTQPLNNNPNLSLSQIHIIAPIEEKPNKGTDLPSNEEEFTTNMYVILKNIEAKRLNTLDFLKVFSLNNNNNSESVCKEQLDELTNKLFALLEISTEIDKSKVKEWLVILLKRSNNDICQVAENVRYLLVNNIREYTDDEDVIFSKKIKCLLLPMKDKIKTSFNYNDNANPCIISFISLRSFFEEEKIEMKEALGEFLFYKLKQTKNNTVLFLYDLDLSILFQIFDNNVNDSKMNEKTETDIEISQEEYSKIIFDFIIQLNDYLLKNQMKVKDLFHNSIHTIDEGFEVINIEDFLDEMKKINIEIVNELDIYCLFNRYKVSDELEVLSLDLISNDLNGLKELDTQELLKKRPMANVPEEEEDESLKKKNGSH